MKKKISLNKKITLILLIISLFPILCIIYIDISTVYSLNLFKNEALKVDSFVLEHISKPKEEQNMTLTDIALSPVSEYVIMNIAILNKKDRQLLDIAHKKELESSIPKIGTMNQMLANKEYCKSRYGIFYKLFYDRTYYGSDFYTATDPFNGSEIIEAQSGKTSVKIRFNSNYLVHSNLRNSGLYVAVPHENTAMGDIIILVTIMYKTLEKYRIICWFSIFLSMIIMLVTLPFLFSTITFPIKKLTQDIKTINKSSNIFINPTITYSTKHNEIGDISRAYTALSLKTNSKINAIEKYSNEIANQLYEPIRKIKEELNILSNNNNSDDNKAHLLQIINNSKRMNIILSKLRNITKIKNKSDNLNSDSIPIDLFIKNFCSIYPIQNKSLLELVLNCKDCTINIQVEHLESLLRELLLNAIEVESRIKISSKIIKINHRKFLSLEVEDGGLGIKDSDKDKIFSNFYSNWQNKNEHIGLGLPLVNAIVDNHDGIITINKSKSLGGACFGIILPLSPKTIM